MRCHLAATKKKKRRENPVLRARPTQIFHFGRFFFTPKSCKITCFFLPKSKHFGWIFLKISQNIFRKIFCKKCQIFFFFFSFRNFHVLGWFLLPGKKMPDRPYLAGPSARKTGVPPPLLLYPHTHTNIFKFTILGKAKHFKKL